jgi:hypothetical protein
LAFTLVAVIPVAAALEIHHELAAADHDGHKYSDNDLCQWVQHQVTGWSLSNAILAVPSWDILTWQHWMAIASPVSFPFFAAGPSRAPPRSSSHLKHS